MSLQAWYPFNGNLENLGLGDLDLTVQTSPTYTTGKVTGQALSYGQFAWTAEQSAKILNNKALSISFWLKATSSGSAGGGTLFGQSYPNRRFCIFTYPNYTDLHLDWRYDDAGNGFIGSVESGFFTLNQWTHCTITFEAPNILKIYKNGGLLKTYTGKGTMNISNFAYATSLDFNLANRYINDFRVYDHCLSPKEVKEISKGLMLHYPLSSPYEIGFKNKYDNPYAEGSCLACTDVYTKTKLKDERGYNYKLKYTGTGGNYWPNIIFPNFNFTAGKRYQYSCKVRLNKYSPTAIGMEMRGSRVNNDWGRPSYYSFNSIPLDGKWHTLSIGVVVPATFDLSGTTKTAAPLIEFYTASLSTSGTVYEMDFDLKDVQVVECDGPVEFIENEILDNTIYDTSGYKNNGVPTNLKLSGDSPRGANSYVFDGTSSGIIVNPSNINPVLTQGGNNPFSYSFWIKNAANDRGIIFGDHMTEGKDASISIEKYTGNILRIWWRNTLSEMLNAVTLPIGEWVHIGITYNGSKLQIYKNGNLTSTITATLPALNKSSTSVFYIGRDTRTDSILLEGNLSDFRIYSTCLSDSDVQELYNKPISIDNNGNLFAQEIIEEVSSGSKFEKTGTVRADNISRCLYNYFTYDGPMYTGIQRNVDVEKLVENNGLKLTCNSTVTTATILHRMQSLMFNGASGNFKVEFDAYSTNPVSITCDICDKGFGAFSLTTTKQHFSGVAYSVAQYNTNSAYNGFFDIEASSIPLGTEIYITNIVIAKNIQKSVGSNYIVMDDIIEN